MDGTHPVAWSRIRHTSSSNGADEPVARRQAGSQEAIIFASLEAGLDGSRGTYTQSALRIPKMVTTAAGDLGSRKQTRPPFLHRASGRSLASLVLACSSSP